MSQNLDDCFKAQQAEALLVVQRPQAQSALVSQLPQTHIRINSALLTFPAHLLRSLEKAGHVRERCCGVILMRCVRRAAVPCAYAHATLKSILL